MTGGFVIVIVVMDGNVLATGLIVISIDKSSTEHTILVFVFTLWVDKMEVFSWIYTGLISIVYIVIVYIMIWIIIIIIVVLIFIIVIIVIIIIVIVVGIIFVLLFDIVFVLYIDYNW